MDTMGDDMEEDQGITEDFPLDQGTMVAAAIIMVRELTETTMAAPDMDVNDLTYY